MPPIHNPQPRKHRSRPPPTVSGGSIAAESPGLHGNWQAQPGSNDVWTPDRPPPPRQAGWSENRRDSVRATARAHWGVHVLCPPTQAPGYPWHWGTDRVSRACPRIGISPKATGTRGRFQRTQNPQGQGWCCPCRGAVNMSVMHQAVSLVGMSPEHIPAAVDVRGEWITSRFLPGPASNSDKRLVPVRHP